MCSSRSAERTHRLPCRAGLYYLAEGRLAQLVVIAKSKNHRKTRWFFHLRRRTFTFQHDLFSPFRLLSRDKQGQSSGTAVTDRMDMLRSPLQALPINLVLPKKSAVCPKSRGGGHFRRSGNPLTYRRTPTPRTTAPQRKFCAAVQVCPRNRPMTPTTIAPLPANKQRHTAIFCGLVFTIAYPFPLTSFSSGTPTALANRRSIPICGSRPFKN